MTVSVRSKVLAWGNVVLKVDVVETVAVEPLAGGTLVLSAHYWLQDTLFWTMWPEPTRS